MLQGYLNFRASGLDCSYGPQQTERGMGQLNLRVPTQGSIAGNQENHARCLRLERLHQMV